MADSERVQIFSERVYPITDVKLSGLSHSEQVQRLTEGGAKLIQLREKHTSPREFYNEAEKALRIASKFGVRIIINDRVDIALTLKADGVHLGQDDLPPEAARRLLGNEAIIGLSTHTIKQAREAARMPVDYLAFGPIFGTSSKGDAQARVGLEELRRVRAAIGQTPLVAIGGIDAANASQVREAGADAVAVISSLLSIRREISSQTRALLNLLR